MAEKTPYVILDGITVEGIARNGVAPPPELHWLEVGQAEAHGSEQAVRAFLDADTTLSEGDHQLKAVPARNWPDPVPAVVAVERTAKIGRAAEPARESAGVA